MYPCGNMGHCVDVTRPIETVGPATNPKESMPSSTWAPLILLSVCFAAAGCRSTETAERLPGNVDYVGSSTVAVFLGLAEPVYGAIRFEIDTEPESLGGERLLREGRADLAGIAKTPDTETLEAGVNAALIGRDAIAVIVNAENPIEDISLSSLDDLFAGRIESWSEIGGAALEVKAFVVTEDSATREVFRKAVLGLEDYAGCESITPDEGILKAVASHPGAIGHISFSLLEHAHDVRAISIDGERPYVTNFDYPISRPMYLLWRSAPVIDAFVEWTQGEEGQRVVMGNFVGRGVIGSVGPKTPSERGILVVHTETMEFSEGWDELTYFPHRPYELLDQNGYFLHRVQNHLGGQDETPARVSLAPGTYLIRTRTSRGKTVELLALVEANSVTEVDVPGLLAKK